MAYLRDQKSTEREEEGSEGYRERKRARLPLHSASFLQALELKHEGHLWLLRQSFLHLSLTPLALVGSIQNQEEMATDSCVLGPSFSLIPKSSFAPWMQERDSAFLDSWFFDFIGVCANFRWHRYNLSTYTVIAKKHINFAEGSGHSAVAINSPPALFYEELISLSRTCSFSEQLIVSPQDNLL